ncbi:IclR family transcriptional regulator [Nonomuraea sp. NPDC005650]|uniref:IclR family transcriptional regulator n=1 Tax=Nonomuraea sp. NPDC005650 TaxID=3157045 RepID=UPI0033AC4761
MPKVRSESTQPLRSAQRMLDVLGSFSIAKSSRTLTEISEELDLAPSTVRRLLLVLEGHDLLILDRETGRYGISPRIARLEMIARARSIIAVAAPILARLCDETKETVILDALDGGECVHIDAHHGHKLISAYNPAGTRFPSWSGLAGGQVLLAWASEQRLRSLVPGPDEWRAEGHSRFATFEELHEELQRVRRRGYAINDRGTDPEAWAVAAPVWSSRHAVDAAISIVIPSSRAKRAYTQQLTAAVRQAADEVTDAWGPMAKEAYGDPPRPR